MTKPIDPISVSSEVREAYWRYLRSLIVPNDPAIARALERVIQAEASSGLVKGPYLEATPPYIRGASSRALIDAGVLSPEFAKLAKSGFPLDRPLYAHQEEAIRAITSGRNAVVATGTGSGKTESFLLPIIDYLLKESAAGTLESGVRALFLYPMNALANDQLKRLRQMLSGVPEITFGRYTGHTKETERQALAAFKEQFPGEPMLPNERLSRERMRAEPPHLLLTNYSMLEYLLLRPRDIELFDGTARDTWQFIVVDEAHVYDGAIGAEVGFLLRRLRERVGASDRLQVIATSATVGGDNTAVASFAADLFGKAFGDGASAALDVHVAQRVSYSQVETWGRIEPDEYRTLPDIDLLAVAQHRGSTATTLGEALAGEQTIASIRQQASETPMTTGDLARRLSLDEPLSSTDIVAAVSVGTRVKTQGGEPVLSARYHLLARATEGAFVCLNPVGPHVHLGRHESCPECGWAMFEMAVCQGCGGIHVVGTPVTEGATRRLTPKVGDVSKSKWYALGSAIPQDDTDEDVEVMNDETPVDPPVAEQGLCVHCGTMIPTPGRACPRPECGGQTTHSITPAPTTNGSPRRCAHCGTARSGIVRRFESGNDASVSVLVTALYPELPTAANEDQVDLPGGGRKLLAFSDSRQQAAFFAPYLESSYGRLAHRRILYSAARDGSTTGHYPAATDIATLASGIASSANFFNFADTAVERQRQANTWTQLELTSTDRRISLEGVGIAQWRLREFGPLPPLTPLTDLGFSSEEIRAIVQILIDSLRRQGAVAALPNVNLSGPEFEPRTGSVSFRPHGSTTKRKVLSWVPTRGENIRSDFLKRIFSAAGSDADVSTFLYGILQGLTAPGSDAAHWFKITTETGATAQGQLIQLAPEAFEMRLADETTALWRCSRCRSLSFESVRSVCPSYRCTGVLEPWSLPNPTQDDDHYRTIYRQTDPIPLTAKEHTAQWSTEQAAMVQQEFVQGRTNVLSCSTTFELGVDVGELQSVVLRNVPPTVSNYVQRAGRAGRRADGAALVLTYAQRRSHDLTAFARPETLIAGRVRTPIVPIENDRIAARHIQSIALAVFLRQEAEAGSEYKTVGSFFSADANGSIAALRFAAWVKTPIPGIERVIANVLPATIAGTGLTTWAGWSTSLVELLEAVTDDFGATTKFYTDAMDEAADKKNFGKANAMKKILNTVESEELLGYLANRNIIPKYGFPVDTVAMSVPYGVEGGDELDLSRDLSQAIFEYAPGQSIVAGGKLWTSAGIVRRENKDWIPYWYAVCDQCGRYWESPGAELGNCPDCGAAPDGIPSKQIEPRFGFVTRDRYDAPKDAPPRTSWQGETFVIDGGMTTRVISAPVTGVQASVLERAKLARINYGPQGRGFKICRFCGAGIPGYEKPQSSHINVRTLKPCAGGYEIYSLSHRYETDVVRVEFDRNWVGAGPGERLAMAQSVLQALLQGAAEVLQLARDDIDGQIDGGVVAGKASLTLIDSVPGGAGYAELIASRLPQILSAALRLTSECECGPETSCYQCLRTFWNQRLHDDLARGLASQYLGGVLTAAVDEPSADGPWATVLTLSSPVLVPAILELEANGAPLPTVGYEYGAEAWPLEWAWPELHVAVVLDDDTGRSAALAVDGWTVFDGRSEDPTEFIASVVATVGSLTAGAASG